MMNNKHILIVDDSEELRDTLSEYLGRSGFIVETVADGDEMRRSLAKKEPNLIILDVMLPGDDGFTLCAQIRKTSNVPIIMLTAVTDEIDRVAGLELGADDYITKTFNPRELLARIKALLRRTYFSQGESESRYINFANWRLDTLTRDLLNNDYAGDAEERKLSGADYRLLVLFLKHPNQPLSRDQISKTIRGIEAMPFDRSIDIQISRLRQKLDDKEHLLIRTLRNEGYILSAEVLYEH